MRADQRKYLITKMTQEVERQIKALQEQLRPAPDMAAHLLKACLRGELKLQPQAHIMAALEKRAEGAVPGENWLSGQRMGFGKCTEVHLLLNELLEVPDSFVTEAKTVTAHNGPITRKIHELRQAGESMETRLMIASDKALEKLVAEIDDMGDISLIQTTLKQLT